MTTPTPSRLFLISCLGLAVVFLTACGSDHKETYVPGAPKATLDVTGRVISWNPIAGASSYNFYVKTVTGCPVIADEPYHPPTKSDTKVAGVSSPLSINDYLACATCYYAAVAAENEVGEGDLSVPVAWQIQTCP
jgi:hypothetical protein